MNYMEKFVLLQGASLPQAPEYLRAYSVELQDQLPVLGNFISIMLTVCVGEVFKCVSLHHNQTSLLTPNTKDENNAASQSKPV